MLEINSCETVNDEWKKHCNKLSAEEPPRHRLNIVPFGTNYIYYHYGQLGLFQYYDKNDETTSKI